MTDFSFILESLAATSPPRSRPLVILAWAQTLDGSVAWRDGAPLAISSEASFRFTHHLRAFCDGILVGIGAVLADDPRLTVRDVPGDHPQPIVLDTHLRLPLDARLLSHPRSPWLLTGPKPPPQRMARLSSRGARVIPLPRSSEGRIDLRAALTVMWSSGIQRLMVEGGPTVHASFLRARLADWVIVTIAPKLLGGLQALTPVGDSRRSLPQIQQMQSMQLGRDLLVWGRLEQSVEGDELPTQ